MFMGDSGSMFVGLAMSATVVEVGGTVDPGRLGLRSTIALLSPLLVVLAVVLIPVLDFLLAVIRRTREGRHPFSADKRHLHHRMLALGHNHRQAVLVFYLWAFVLSSIAVALGFTAWQNVLWPAVAGVTVAVLATGWPWVRAKRLGRARRAQAMAAIPAHQDAARADPALAATTPHGSAAASVPTGTAVPAVAFGAPRGDPGAQQ
jgi:UDP-GlcNAc:undecaprenyl-phosphate GlcNAc-1-phosphate transferase